MKRKIVKAQSIPFLLGFVAGAFCMQIWMTSDPLFQLLKNHPATTNIDLRRELAAELQKLYLHLFGNEEYNKDVQKIEALKNTIQHLDPETHAELEMKESLNGPVCPEKFLGTRKGRPLFHGGGYEKVPCDTERPMKELLTVVMDLVNSSEEASRRIFIVLQGIWSLYPDLPVVVVHHDNPFIPRLQKKNSDKKLKVLKHSSKDTHGFILNSIIRDINTPYVFLSRNLIHFTNFSSFERLVRMAWGNPRLAVVAGSFRNSTGYWTAGCLQSHMKNYALKVEEGYRYSVNDCMFCDMVQGPMILNTSVAKEIQFDQSMELVIEDFLVRSKHSGYHIVTCPDVMFFADQNVEVSFVPRQEWLPFASKWKISEVLLPEARHEFWCSEVDIQCSSKVTGTVMLPRCCINQFHHAFHNLTTFLEEQGIAYEIFSGSQMASMKFSGYLPWDIDGDVNIEPNGYLPMLAARSSARFKDGLTLRLIQKLKPGSQDGLFHLYTPDIMVEIYTQNVLGYSLLPEEYRKHRTRSKMGPFWVEAQPNPALYARNRYGPGILKHAQSWSVLNLKDSWIHQKTGFFSPCSTPYFHSCLDRFPSDGNMDFVLK